MLSSFEGFLVKTLIVVSPLLTNGRRLYNSSSVRAFKPLIQWTLGSAGFALLSPMPPTVNR